MTPTQQSDALAERCANALARDLLDGRKITAERICTTCHLPERLALEEAAVRLDQEGENYETTTKFRKALAALAEAKRKEQV